MKNVGSDALVFARNEPARAFVQHDEAGRVGCADALMRAVHAGPGV